MRGAGHIFGGAGADSLNGAGGADVIFGAGGNDTLDTSHFHTGGVQTATEVVLYDALTGFVSDDADANGAGVASHLALLHAGQTISASDFLVIWPIALKG